MGREVVNIRNSDIFIFIGWSSVTLGELAIAYDEGKLIGVLTETGGITHLVKDILEACNKQTGASVIYGSDPQKLIDELLEAYRTEHFRRPSCFCRGTCVQLGSPSDGMEQDVVCQMWIDPETAAAQRTRKGSRYVFCSLQCAERFDAQPDDFCEESMPDER
mgnify:FL=1